MLATTLMIALMGMSGYVAAETGATNATVEAVTTSAPQLSTFHKLVQQAGLSGALEAPGPVTVFAPTDDAFKAVPAATLDKLSKDQELLKSVLTYHVVPGSVKAASLNGNTPLATLNGAQLAVSKAGEFVTVDDGLVTQADLAASNGVVHVIDRVLMPAVKK
ncbi:MAG: fasciclin domain-containing protein [Rubrivivax sp.]|nr:MAG: fasciclin domain-containing protein [Rubrivivax sp.]